MYAGCGLECTSPERTNPEHTSPERTSRLGRKSSERTSPERISPEWARLERKGKERMISTVYNLKLQRQNEA